MPVVPLRELVEVVAEVLQRSGAQEPAAGCAANAIGYAEASGVASHGLIRVGPLADQLASGKINGRARPDVTPVGESVVLVDAQHGLGYAAATVATDEVMRRASDAAFAMAAVSRSHHFGVAGLYVERLAERGLVGLAVSGTFGAIAPTGGHTALLGNPPVALGVPRASGGPVVIDFAPAVVARGKIVAAAHQGTAIPREWARDARGEPTDDPNEALKGTLRAAGGHKGVLLAMMADLMVLTLTRSNPPGEASSVFTPDGPPPSLGHVILAVNPGLFGTSDITDRVTHYVDALTDDSDIMRVPGDRRRSARLAAERTGIDVDKDVWTDLGRRII